MEESPLPQGEMSDKYTWEQNKIYDTGPTCGRKHYHSLVHVANSLVNYT